MTVNGQIMTLLLVRESTRLIHAVYPRVRLKYATAFNQIIEDHLEDSDLNSIVRRFAALSGKRCLHAGRLYFTRTDAGNREHLQ